MPLFKPAGLLMVISAPSGCGKTTIVNQLLSRNPNLARSVTATTRKPRKGEVDGRDYFFITEREFREQRRKKAFLEWAQVFGNYYGTFKHESLEKLRKGTDIVLAIDVQGARQVRRKIKGVFIFIMPPSMEDLEKRLFSRESDPREEIQKRLEQARAEMACAKGYDYIVTNRYVNETILAIENIMKKEKKKQMEKKQKLITSSKN